MVVTIKAVAPKSGETRLCDAPARGKDRCVAIGTLEGAEQRNKDLKEGFRALTAQPIDRGNSRLKLQFSVTRECASFDAARSWLLAHIRDCVRSGTLIIAQDTGTTVYNNAALEIVRFYTTGVSIFVTYAIDCEGIAS